jgi:ABC-type Na+ efflux pump permease subunit
LTSGTLGADISGSIAGYSATLAISGNDLVLNVVPEPSTIALLGVAVIGLLGYGLRIKGRLGRERE